MPLARGAGGSQKELKNGRPLGEEEDHRIKNPSFNAITGPPKTREFGNLRPGMEQTGHLYPRSKTKAEGEGVGTIRKG